MNPAEGMLTGGDEIVDRGEFEALARRAGMRLTEAELADLRARFDAALRIIAPLGEIDLGEGDLAVSFSPREGPFRKRL